MVVAVKEVGQFDVEQGWLLKKKEEICDVIMKELKKNKRLTR